MAHRFMREGEPGHTNGVLTDDKGRFNGAVVCHEDCLNVPLKRKKPTVYSIWNDLFHEDVDSGFQYKTFKTAYDLRNRHTFLFLTKRPKVMLRFMTNPNVSGYCSGLPFIENGKLPDSFYLGLTVCNQQEADEKIPIFLQVPGKKFLSIEPMLGDIDFSYNHFCGVTGWGPPDPPRRGEDPQRRLESQSRWVLGKIDAVILGGETGPRARPMYPDWVRSVRDQCQAAGVPFYFKGWGEWTPDDFNTVLSSGRSPKRISVMDDGYWDNLALPYGIDMMRIKSRLLDGREHNNLPWVTE